MSISEKLAAIEAEAREAEEVRLQQEVSLKRKASKRLREKQRSRRKSTLSPEELAQLLGMR